MNDETNSDLEVDFLSELPHFIQGIHSEDPSQQLQCTRLIRTMLGVPTAPQIEQVMDSGLLPRLLQFVQENKHNELTYESIWVLLEIASELDDTTPLLITSTHTILINLLQHPLYEIKLISIWTLGNIVGAKTIVRDLLLKHEILPNLSLICQLPFHEKYVTNFNNNPKIDNNPHLIFIHLLAITSWVLTNLARPAKFANIEHMELLVQCFLHLWRQALLHQNHRDIHVEEHVNEIFSSIGWGFSYLIENGYEQLLIDKINENGLIEQFVNFIDHQNKTVQHSMLRVIGDILSLVISVEPCLLVGILDKYYDVLSNTNSSFVKREICWAISNITAGTSKHKLAFVSSNLHPILISFIENETWLPSKEALWAIGNLTPSRDIFLIEPLVRQGVIRALCVFLRKWLTVKNKSLVICLETMNNIMYTGQYYSGYDKQFLYVEQFEKFGAVQCLESLQCDDSSDRVYQKSVQIMTEYYKKQWLDLTSNKLKCTSGKSHFNENNLEKVVVGSNERLLINYKESRCTDIQRIRLCANHKCKKKYFEWFRGQKTRCSRCKLKHYCSRRCQKWHWKHVHRYLCR